MGLTEDEIHAPLNYTSTPFMPYLAVNDAARRTGVCVTSASKSWNLAGLKCAQVVTSDEDIRQRLDALPISMPWRASMLGAWASVAAYRDGQPWLDEVMGVLAGHREYLAERIATVLPKRIATAPSAPPSASEPVSPMNTCAGFALNQRKPRQAPTIAVRMSSSMCGRSMAAIPSRKSSPSARWALSPSSAMWAA